MHVDLDGAWYALVLLRLQVEHRHPTHACLLHRSAPDRDNSYRPNLSAGGRTPTLGDYDAPMSRLDAPDGSTAGVVEPTNSEFATATVRSVVAALADGGTCIVKAEP